MRAPAAVLLLVFAACSCNKPKPCARDVDCPSNQSCSPQGCVSCPACSSSDRCVGGQCLPINCGQLACHSGQGCEGGECVDGTCLNVTCPMGQTCVQGSCLPQTCGGVACAAGQVCSNGACVTSVCVGVVCPAGQSCADGTCLSQTCGGQSCPGGSVCSQSACIESDCVGVLCAGGELCTGGLCLPTSCGAMQCLAGQVCLLGRCVEASSDGGPGLDAGSPVVCADGGGGCVIDGGAVPCGQPNPANPCQSCQPAVTSSDWTAFADGTSCDAGEICGYGQCVPACDVMGTLLPPGVLNPANGCQACQPQASTSAFTDVADATPCGTGKLCSAGTCAASCAIAGASFAPGALELSNACHVCAPGVSTSAWSNEPDGTSCSAGKVCAAGNCSAECYLDGGLVTAGTLEPTNFCAACQPVQTPTNWTRLPDGTACGVNGACLGGDCTCGGGARTFCGTACVDLKTNGANCGTCGKRCPVDAGAQSACFMEGCAFTAPLSQPRAGAAAATGPDGLIYLFGGTSGGYLYYNAPQCNPPVAQAPLIAEVDAYDPVNNAWSAPSMMMTPRDMLGAVTGRDGKLYAVGGATRDPASGYPLPSNALESYDSATKGWASLAPMPTARFGLGVAVGADGRIYALGGCAGFTGFRGQAPQYYCSTVVPTVEVYSPDAGTWATLPPLPAAVWGLEGVGGVDGNIYAIGGEGFCNSTSIYNPVSNSWDAGVGTPNACYAAALSGPDGRLYVFGGGNSSPYECGPNATSVNVSSSLTAYTLGTSTWAQLGGLVTPRAWVAGSLAPDGRLFVFGGVTPVSGAFWPPIGSVEVYDPSLGFWAP